MTNRSSEAPTATTGTGRRVAKAYSALAGRLVDTKALRGAGDVRKVASKMSELARKRQAPRLTPSDVDNPLIQHYYAAIVPLVQPGRRTEGLANVLCMRWPELTAVMSEADLKDDLHKLLDLFAPTRTPIGEASENDIWNLVERDLPNVQIDKTTENSWRTDAMIAGVNPDDFIDTMKRSALMVAHGDEFYGSDLMFDVVDKGLVDTGSEYGREETIELGKLATMPAVLHRIVDTESVSLILELARSPLRLSKMEEELKGYAKRATDVDIYRKALCDAIPDIAAYRIRNSPRWRDEHQALRGHLAELESGVSVESTLLGSPDELMIQENHARYKAN